MNNESEKKSVKEKIINIFKYICIFIAGILAFVGLLSINKNVLNAATETWVETETIDIEIEIDLSEMNAEQTYKLFNFLYESNFVFDNGEYEVDLINNFNLEMQIEYTFEYSKNIMAMYINNEEIVVSYVSETNLGEFYMFEMKQYNSWVMLNGTIEIPKEIYNNVWINGYGMGYANGENVGYGQGYSDGESFGYDSGYNEGYNEGYDLGYAAGEIDGFNNGYNNGYAAGVLAGENKAYSDGYFEGRNDGIDIGYDLGYADGESDGYDLGYADGESDGIDIGYNDGYSFGYDSGYNEGYNEGYNKGYNEGFDSTEDGGAWAVLFAALLAPFNLLSIELFKGVTIGMIVLIPIVFGLLAFIFKLGGRK